MNPRVVTAFAGACVVALMPAVASAAITSYTDRSAWRTAAGASSTGNLFDDLNAALDPMTSPGNLPRGTYSFTSSGVYGAFPNANANTDVNGTGYLRCFAQVSSPPQWCTISIPTGTTALVMDINPQSTAAGAQIGVQLGGGAGSTTFTLSATNVTSTWGIVSTTPFTYATFSAVSGSSWFGIDDVELLPAAPTVSSITPTSGPPVGGTSVTIRGYGFNTVGGTPTVSIGGTAATPVTVNDYTSLTATTPAGSLGAASVLVTPPGTAGANAANSLFTYALAAARTPTFGTPAPTADGFTVQLSNYDANWNWAGTATAGGTVSVSGTGLVTVTGVAPGTSSTATITATRSGYTDGSATISGTSWAPLVADESSPGPPAALAVSLPLVGMAPPGAVARLVVGRVYSRAPLGPISWVRPPRAGAVGVVGTAVLPRRGAMPTAIATSVVCTGSASIRRRGGAVQCRLNSRGRAALRTRGLRVSLRVTLVGTGAEPGTVMGQRAVWLPRRARVAVTG